jgi:hypothetical protein
MRCRVAFRSHFSPYKVEDNRSKTQGEIWMRSFTIVMTVTGYCVPPTIRTIRISNKRRHIWIRAKPDRAPCRTTMSTSNARRGNSKITSAIWQLSGLNGVCQSGRNNKTGSPRSVESVRPGQVSAFVASALAHLDLWIPLFTVSGSGME